MTLFPKRRAWLTIGILCTVTLAGAFAGAWLGREIVRKRSLEALVKDEGDYLAQADSLFDEARHDLALMNASTTPYCSDEQLVQFRQMIYHSVNIRDAGKMRGNHMDCSTLHEPEELSRNLKAPNMIRRDGVKFYTNAAPYLPAPGAQEVYALQLGDSYVVEDPQFEMHIHEISGFQEGTMLDAPTGAMRRIANLPFHVSGAAYNRNEQGLLHGLIYATRCSTHNDFCTTLSREIAPIERANRAEILLFSLFGAALGIIIGLLHSLLRQRDQHMATQLLRAIRRDKLTMVYQPIVDLQSGRWIGAEALARWKDDEQFNIRPEIFVQIAEERGFVCELTRTVVLRVLMEMGELLRSDADFHVHINISAFDLADEGFLPMLSASLDEAGVSPTSIHLEITESSTARMQEAVETIRQLRAVGHQVEIDDFGTGYSSLVYLKDLRVDAIKIDKAFTQTIGTEAVIGSLLPQILAMAEALDLNVIAEGIETEAQADFFASWRFPVQGQGWHFGRPIPAEEFRQQHFGSTARS
jgi:sensor c-di-GMP phosphodiesterase-like protein